jgi:ABC-2 type transport system permease protein
VVGDLIGMKARVLRNSLRGRAGASFAIGGVVGLLVASIGVVLIAGQAGGITVGTDVASALFAIWMLGWLFGPILTGGGDETLRPENFVLLPLRPHQLAVGLLGASLVGVSPPVTLLLFSGLVLVALPAGALTVLVAVLAVAAQLALVVLLSRVVIAGLGDLLGSRRGKDLGVLLGALVGLAYLPARWVFEQLGPIVVGQSSPALTATLRALPSGWGPNAVAAAAAHDWLTAIAWLLALAVLDAVLVVAWSRLLVRRLTSGGSPAGPRRTGRRDARALRRTLLPDSPLGAVIGKELTLWRRDAQRRTMMLVSIVIGLLLPAFSLTQGGGASGLGFSALWIVVFATMQVSNLYGMDGTAVWQTLTTPGAARADVRGRQWAWALVVGPVAVVAALVLPGVTGATSSYPWVLALVPALVGAGAGTVLRASVESPYPMPNGKARNPLGGGRSGGGVAAVLRRMLLMLVQLVVTVPVVVVLVLGTTGVLPAATWLAIPFGVACGTGAAWWWGRRAHRGLELRGPEVLAALRAPV